MDANTRYVVAISLNSPLDQDDAEEHVFFGKSEAENKVRHFKALESFANHTISLFEYSVRRGDWEYIRRHLVAA